MRNRIASMCTSLLLCTPFAVQAEEGWHWEFASDLAIPNGKLGPATLTHGLGFDATIAYGFTPKLGTYFGWNWHRFTADSALTGSKVDVNESGFVWGLQWRDRFAQTDFDYRLRAGVVYNQIELEDSRSIIADTKHGTGWEMGAALLIPLIGHWVLTPSIRYRSLSRSLTPLNQAYAVDLRYYTLGAGILLRF